MRWFLPVVVSLASALTGCVSASKVNRSSSRPVDASMNGYFTTTAIQGVAKVRNITYFDLATCTPQAPPVTAIYGDEQLLGALASARPAVLECLVDPGQRGPSNETRVTVTATASPGAGVEATVSGQNLPPAGQLCALAAIRGALGGLPSLPEGWPDVAAQVTFIHSVDTLPAVVPRVNDLSDAAGQIRLAVPSMCACFEPWREAPPRELNVLLTLRRPLGLESESKSQGLAGRVRPWKVHTPRELGPADAPVAACLQEKLAELEFKAPKLEVDVPFSFTFIDSRQDGPLPGLPPWLQHKQMEAVRNRRFSEMAIALGVRSSAARNYDALVQRYQGDRRSMKVKALTQACVGLLEADDAWEDALHRKLEAERLALDAARTLPEEREIVAARLVETERSLATVAQVRRVDERACPKVLKGRARQKTNRDEQLLQVTPFKP